MQHFNQQVVTELSLVLQISINDVGGSLMTSVQNKISF